MSARLLLPGAFAVLLLIGLYGKAIVVAAAPVPFHPDPEAGTFPPKWIAGLDCANDPKIQVHAYNDDFWILRQSKCAHFEAPFVYVIFGTEKALVIDTGSVASVGFGEAVLGLVDSWSQKNLAGSLEIIVSHSHAHSDHTAGDPEFAGMPNVTVVGHSLTEVQAFFGFDPAKWPEEQVTYDLGGRVLDVLTTPGHQVASLTFYDRRTQLLLTGDIVYPGHLFVFSQQDWGVFKTSIERLLNFAGKNPVEWVLGCHIEWSSQPGGCYPWGTAAHPDEHVLQLEPQVLKNIHENAREMGDTPVCGDVQDNFVIHPVYLCPISAGC